jgi:signal transduction histidine kinase
MTISRPRALDRRVRWFAQRTLPVQCALVGAAATCVVALLTRWLVPTPDAAVYAWAAAAGGAAVVFATTWIALRAARDLEHMAELARKVLREGDTGVANFELDGACFELRRSLHALRRLLEAHRERVGELVATVAAIGSRLDDRTNELSTLQDLSINLASKSGIHELVDEALGALEKTLDYTSATVWARERPEGEVLLLGCRSPELEGSEVQSLQGQRLSRQNLAHYRQIEASGVPILVNHSRQNLLSWLWLRVTDDARSSSLYRSTRAWMALPLKFRDEVLGVLRVDHHEPDYFDDERVRLLTAIGSQAALAIRQSRLQEQERVVAVTAERNRIARELHDAVSQTLFAAHVQAGTLATVVERDPAINAAHVLTQAKSLERLIHGALAEMRMLMFELRPDALQNTRLAELLQHAIGALQCRGELEIEHRLAAQEPLTDAVRIHVYRIAQEALANVSRHSGAQHVLIEWKVEHEPARATLRIVDDGKGFDAAQERPGHFGLGNMRTRAEEIGAALRIVSQPGQGSEVVLQLDLASSTATAATSAAISIATSAATSIATLAATSATPTQV